MREKIRVAAAVEQEAETQRASEELSDAALLALYNDDPDKVFAVNDKTNTHPSAPSQEEDQTNDQPNDVEEGEEEDEQHSVESSLPENGPTGRHGYETRDNESVGSNKTHDASSVEDNEEKEFGDSDDEPSSDLNKSSAKEKGKPKKAKPMAIKPMAKKIPPKKAGDKSKPTNKQTPKPAEKPDRKSTRLNSSHLD